MIFKETEGENLHMYVSHRPQGEHTAQTEWVKIDR